MKKERKRTAPKVARQAPKRGQGIILALCTVLFSLAVCVSTGSASKAAALALSLGSLTAVCLFFGRLRDRIGAPLLMLAAYTGMGGISTLYAVSGKFALYEFLKLLGSFCLCLLLLTAVPGRGAAPGRWIASVLTGYAALCGVVSIDLISTRVLSSPVLELLARASTEYAELGGVEPGVRMTSMFGNPNVFAGIAGIGCLLSLGLILSAESKRERAAQTVMLYINALSFLLSFSMGATAAIALSFVLILVLERRERRMDLLLLMLETLVLAVLAAAVISATSFDVWTGPRAVPDVCLVLGAAALCLLDRFVGQPLAVQLSGRGGLVPAVTGGTLVLMVLYAVTAYHLTGPATLETGGTLRRAIYPDTGTYTLAVASDRHLEVTIETQDQQETMMHTSTILYSGDASAASFVVPENSLVVYFNFFAPEGANVQDVSYSGENGGGEVPLGYKLLPGFIANRLQGLWANENAIQRFVFFSDGLALARRSPIIGLGLGSFDNGVRSVQSFRYATRYAHNHYIQTLAETGVIGLILFLLLLGGCAAAVLCDRRRGERCHPLTPALGAALLFMAAHAAVEVVFSFYAFLPAAFGVFTLISLCCGGSLPGPHFTKRGQTVSLLTFTAYLAVAVLLLGANMRAAYLGTVEPDFASLAEAVSLDRFEWADYALAYVQRSVGTEDSAVRQQADRFAEDLAALDSNTAPFYLASYYFQTDRPEDGIAMVEKYVDYVSADPEAWDASFHLLEQYAQDTESYRTGVQRIVQMLEEWDAANIGEITLDEQSQAFIARMDG